MIVKCKLLATAISGGQDAVMPDDSSLPYPSYEAIRESVMAVQMFYLDMNSAVCWLIRADLMPNSAYGMQPLEIAG